MLAKQKKFKQKISFDFIHKLNLSSCPAANLRLEWGRDDQPGLRARD